LAATPVVLADAPCYKNYRNFTPAETARMKAVLQAVQDALPPPPPGWVIAGDDQPSVPQSLCQDVGEVPFQYTYTRYYRQVGDADARQKLVEDQAARDAAVYERKKPRLEAIQAQMEKLSAQQVALIQKGDFAGAEKLNPQVEKLQTEYQKVADEGYDTAQQAAVAKASAHDLEMSISVGVNSLREIVPAEAAAATPPQGVQSAYRWHTESESVSNDEALYLLGLWKPIRQNSWRTGTRPGAPLSAAHTITIRVVADPERLPKTVAAINFAKIAATLK
jgi:hypothetical protein